MRSALVLVTLAACKSSTPAPAAPVETRPDEPADVGPCLPAYVEVFGNRGGVLKVCEVDDNTSCFSVEANGRVTAIDGSDGPPMHELDDTEYRDCPSSTDEGCTTLALQPEPGWHAVDGSLSLGGLVDIAFQSGDRGRLEVWDPSGPTRLGGVDLVAAPGTASTFLADFIGDMAMSILDTSATREVRFWRLDRGALVHVADLPVQATDWATFDQGHAAFLGDNVLQIYELATARPGPVVDWPAALDPAYRDELELESVYVYLFEDDLGGRSVVAIDAYDGGPMAGLGMFDVDGKVTRIPVRRCSEEGEGE